MKKLALGICLFVSTVCFSLENLDLLLSPEEISSKVKEVALEIDQEYGDEGLTVLMVMKGAVCITSDLIRSLHIPFTLENIKASSYGKNGKNRGELKVKGLKKLDLAGKNVLIVDDIFDSGKTMSALVERVKGMGPKSVKSLVLLSKKIDREITYRPDYSLFEIEPRFIVGYGLDYKEYYRGLPGIYAFVDDAATLPECAKN